MAAKEGITERQVVVITGASSGIGMTTALYFAEHDYNVVLAARRMNELKEVERRCEELSVEALAVETDVSNADDMDDLRVRAIEAFGRIDVWINNAGIYAVGMFKDMPLKDMRRLMDVNFFGYVYGSRSALTEFRRQGYGTLINVSSVNAAAPQPYVAIYSASKAAIRALGESVRMELKIEGLDNTVKISTVMPAVVDTNIFHNAANYTGRKIQALEPVYDPSYVAKRIYQVAVKPKREKFIGPAGTYLALKRTHTPGMYENEISAFTDKNLLRDETAPDTEGNFYEPLASNRGMRGGWREKRVRADHANLALGAVAAAIAGVVGISVFLAKKSRS